MVQSNDVLIVIPARLESSRLDKKLLRTIGSKSVIAHVCERVALCHDVADMLIATDSTEILDHVTELDYPVVLSKGTHRNGTERAAEVAHDLSQYNWIVNVQGDEPFISPDDIRALIRELKDDNSIVSMYTLIVEDKMLRSESVVKVLFDHQNYALDFARHSFDRKQNYQHIGVYGFERDVLIKLVTLDPTPHELDRSLEQMRWLDNGYDIKMVYTPEPSISIDTISDLKNAREYFQSKIDLL